MNAVADGISMTLSRPDPEVFLKAAATPGLSPAACLVAEDAHAGVRAAGIVGPDCAAMSDARKNGQAD